MKLPAPCMTGQENLLDFAGPRGKASGELKEFLKSASVEQVATVLKISMAERAKDRLAEIAGMTPAQYREFEINREHEKINDAMRAVKIALNRLQTYTSEAELDVYIVALQDQLPKMVGGK